MRLRDLLGPRHAAHPDQLPNDATASYEPRYPDPDTVFEDVADVVYGSAPVDRDGE